MIACVPRFTSYFLSSRRSGQDTAINAVEIGRVVCYLAHGGSRLTARVAWALEHTSLCWRNKSLNDITERVSHVRNRLTLDDLLVNADQSFDKTTVLGERVMECGGDINLAQIRLNRLVGRSKLQVDHDAIDEVDCAVDKTVVPDLGLAHLHGNRGDLVADKGSLYRTGLTRVDFQSIRLEELGQALNVRKTEISITPQ